MAQVYTLPTARYAGRFLIELDPLVNWSAVPGVIVAADGSGWLDYTRLPISGGVENRVISKEIEDGADRPVRTLRATLHMNTAAGSLSSGAVDSPYNTLPGSFSPAIFGGRRIIVQDQIAGDPGSTNPAHYRARFWGFLDDPIANSAGDVELFARDAAARLMVPYTGEPVWIGEEGTLLPLDEAIQAILDATMGAGVWRLKSPGGDLEWAIPAFELGNVTSALQTVRETAQQRGAVVRWWFDSGTGRPQLSLFVLQEDKGSPDFTYSAAETEDIPAHGSDVANYRNDFTLKYVDADGNVQTIHRAATQAEKDSFGFHPLSITQASTSHIRDAGSANVMLDSIEGALRVPATIGTRKIPRNSAVEVNTLIRFAGDGRVTQENVDLYVTHWTEREAMVGGRLEAYTQVSLRAAPTGQLGEWLRSIQGAAQRPRPVPQNWPITFDIEIDAATGAAFLTPNTPSEEVQSWRVRAVVGDVNVDSWADPVFDDEQAGELSGGPETWGTRISLGLNVDTGEAVYVAGYGFDTPDDEDEAQEAARRSRLIRVWRSRDTAGPNVMPILDRDGLKLFLHPNRNSLAQSIRYVVSKTGAPTEGQVESGTVSTDDSIEVYEWDPEDGEETVWVGVIPYTEDDGTGTQGPLRVRQRTFTSVTEGPIITWWPVKASSADKSAVQLVISNSAAQFAIFYRTYAEGATPPAFTRVPGSGFLPGPVIHTVEVDVPDEGQPDIILEAYGQDDDGLQSDKIVLRIDSNLEPSGTLSLEVDGQGRVWVTPNTSDTDSGSWRARVVKGSAFADPEYENVSSPTVWEGAGTQWGARVDTGLRVVGAETVFMSGRFYRTTNPSPSAQENSRKSRPYRDWKAASGGVSPDELSLTLTRVERTLMYDDVRVTAGSRIAHIWVFDFLYAANGPVPPPPTDIALRSAVLTPGQIYRVHRAPAGHERIGYFFSYTAERDPGQAKDYRLGPAVIMPPQIQFVRATEGIDAGHANVEIGLFDASGLGGHLRVWTNPTSQQSATLAGPPDIVHEVSATPATVGPAQAGGLANVPVHPIWGKTIFVEFVNSDGVSTEAQSHHLQGFSTAVGFDDELRPEIVKAITIADENVLRAKLAIEAVGENQLGAGAATRVKIGLAAIDAARTDITQLSDVAANLGAMTQGRLDNLPASVTFDLSATGSQVVFGAPKFAIFANGDATFAGALQAATGTFVGALSAATGTFSGALSAATGTFAGTLQAVDGTFTGTLTAVGGTFTGTLSGVDGTFTGTLSAAGGTFAGNLTAAGGTFTGELIAANGTFTGTLSGVNGTFTGTLTAGASSAVPLSALNANLGEIVAGTIRNPGNQVGIAIGAAPSGGWSSYVNLFTGSSFFLYGGGGQFTVTHGGQLTATGVDLSGHIVATSGTFSGTVTSSAVTLTGGRIRNSDNTVGLNLGPNQQPGWQSYVSFHTNDDFIRGFSSRFRVDHLGNAFMTHATVTGTITAGSTIAASAFTAAMAVFQGAMRVGNIASEHVHVGAGSVEISDGAFNALFGMGWSSNTGFLTSLGGMVINSVGGDLALAAGGSAVDLSSGAIKHKGQVIVGASQQISVQTITDINSNTYEVLTVA